jgi:hypothetical protein
VKERLKERCCLIMMVVCMFCAPAVCESNPTGVLTWDFADPSGPVLRQDGNDTAQYHQNMRIVVNDLNTIHYDVVIDAKSETLFVSDDLRKKAIPENASESTSEGIAPSLSTLDSLIKKPDGVVGVIDAKTKEVSEKTDSMVVAKRLLDSVINDRGIRSRTELLRRACASIDECRNSADGLEKWGADCTTKVYTLERQADQIESLATKASGKLAKQRDKIADSIASLKKARQALEEAFALLKSDMDVILSVYPAISKEVQVCGDRFSVTLTLVDKNEKSALAALGASDPSAITFRLSSDPKVSREFFVVGGWKRDYSAGVGWDRLVDRDYGPVKTQVEDESGTPIVDDEGNPVFVYKVGSAVETDKFELAPAAFTHFYHRGWPSRSLQVAGTLGLTAQDLTKARILLGGSFIIGDRERVVLTYGAVGGTAKRLKPRLATGDIVDQDAIIAVDRKSWSQFFALTYNW